MSDQRVTTGFRVLAGVIAAIALVASGSLVSGQSTSAIRVAAAADLKFVMPELVSLFEKKMGTHVEVSYGSSGNFFAQLQNGAPFDAFFSADSEYPRKLSASGLVEHGDVHEYAVGRLVLWTPAKSAIDVTHAGWQALTDPAVHKIAIASPEHAPYGRAAVAALQKSGLYEQVSAKLVYGEDISQAAQFAESGNAQVGIIAMSLAVSPRMRSGKYWEIPEDSYSAIKQSSAVLRQSSNKEAARSFVAFVTGPDGRAILERFGFSVPADAGFGPKS